MLADVQAQRVGLRQARASRPGASTCSSRSRPSSPGRAWPRRSTRGRRRRSSSRPRSARRSPAPRPGPDRRRRPVPMQVTHLLAVASVSAGLESRLGEDAVEGYPPRGDHPVEASDRRERPGGLVSQDAEPVAEEGHVVPLEQRLKDAELVEPGDAVRPDRVGRERVRAQLVAVDDRDAGPGPRQPKREDGAGDATADHHDVEPAAHGRPSGRGRPGTRRAREKARVIGVRALAQLDELRAEVVPPAVRARASREPSASARNYRP